MTITPIISAQSRSVGKIVVLNEIKRARTMVATVLGARAILHFKDICGSNSRFLIRDSENHDGAGFLERFGIA